MVIRGSDKSIGLYSFSHDITGGGVPVATHSNVPSSPLVIKVNPGCLAILGNPDGVLPAKDKKKNSCWYFSYQKLFNSSTNTNSRFPTSKRVCALNQCHFGGKNVVAVVILLRVLPIVKERACEPVSFWREKRDSRRQTFYDEFYQ